MISTSQFNKEIDLIIANAIREDVGAGDHSSLACIPYDAAGKAKLLVKENGVISGVEFAKRVFNYVDPGLTIDVLIEDGSWVKPGDICFMFLEIHSLF
jgi:nicotinate-nucleotide pyrophosphorylase (carboxylating)